MNPLLSKGDELPAHWEKCVCELMCSVSVLSMNHCDLPREIVRESCRVRFDRKGWTDEEAIYEERIIGILREADSGIEVKELCRKHA